MKTNILYKLGIAVLLAALLMLTGCKDSFLEVEPGKKMTLTEYFSTDEHIYEAVAATYHPMRLFDWNGATYNPINICSEVMTDNFWAGGADLNDYTYWHYMEDFKADPLHTLEGIWKQCYLGVKNANDVLSYVETGKDKITAEHQKLYTEEAMVLRAFYYCQLWKFYGYIPVYMKNLTSPYTCEQSAPDAAYDAIITSLEEAIAIGALPMQWDDANLGRVNRATAYMLYAEMVMYQNDESRYSKALEYMRKIINSGQFALHDDYAALWTKEGEWTKESIFEINYTDGPNGKRAYGGGVGNVGGTWLPRLISPEGGVAADGVDNGWGAAPVRTDAYDKFTSGDARRDATCYRPASGSYKPRYEDTGIWLSKYIARSANLQNIAGATDGNYANNLRIYRYAETLLNAAELLVRTNGSAADAQQYLNLVHHRSGLTDNKAATIDNIIAERDLEFMGEGKRYWDLVRTGKAVSVLVPDADGYRKNTWSEARKYVPIPQAEIDAAGGGLVQHNY